jgi:hypothetical protein
VHHPCITTSRIVHHTAPARNVASHAKRLDERNSRWVGLGVRFLRKALSVTGISPGTDHRLSGESSRGRLRGFDVRRYEGRGHGRRCLVAGAPGSIRASTSPWARLAAPGRNVSFARGSSRDLVFGGDAAVAWCHTVLRTSFRVSTTGRNTRRPARRRRPTIASRVSSSTGTIDGEASQVSPFVVSSIRSRKRGFGVVEGYPRDTQGKRLSAIEAPRRARRLTAIAGPGSACWQAPQ